MRVTASAKTCNSFPYFKIYQITFFAVNSDKNDDNLHEDNNR